MTIHPTHKIQHVNSADYDLYCKSCKEKNWKLKSNRLLEQECKQKDKVYGWQKS